MDPAIVQSVLNATTKAAFTFQTNKSLSNVTMKISNTSTSSKFLIPQLNLNIGLLGGILNLLALLCIFSNKKFLAKSAFLTGLFIGNLFNSGYSITNGCQRLLNEMYPGRYPNYTAWDCMLAPFIPTWALLGGDGPSLIILLFGFERFSALAIPQWHFKNWKPRYAWIAVAAVYVYTVMTVFAAWFVVAYINPLDSGVPNSNCFVHSVIGLYFSIYYYGSQIFCGVTAMISTLTALAVGWYRLKRTNQNKLSQNEPTKRLRKQINLTRHMLVLAVVDFFLVAVSNIVLYLTMLTDLKLVGLPSGASNHGAIAYCCNATVCVVAYLCVNKQFRDIFLKFYRLDKCFRFCMPKVCKQQSTKVAPLTHVAPWRAPAVSTSNV